METDTLIQLGMLLVTVSGVIVAIVEVRRSQSRQASDRAEYYGRMTAVMEGLAEGQRRHAQEIAEIKRIQVAHGNTIAVLHERIGRATDTGVPGVAAKL